MLRAAALILVGLASGCVYDMSRPRRDQNTDRALLGDLGLGELIASSERAADRSASDGRPSACNSGSFAKETYYDAEKRIAVCEDKSRTPYVQCLAAQRCASGWHLCTATEYRARIGPTLPDTTHTADAWIGSCVRDGGGLGVPTDSVCTCNHSQKTDAGALPVAWTCLLPVAPLTALNDLYVGLVSWDGCKRVGINETVSLDGAWLPVASSSATPRSFCCQ